MIEAGRIVWEKATLNNVFSAVLENWKFDFIATGNHYLVISNSDEDYCLLETQGEDSLSPLFKAIYLQLERTGKMNRPQPPRAELLKFIDKEKLLVSIEAKRRWNMLEKFRSQLL